MEAAMSSLMPVFNRIDIAFDRGEGAYLFATDGRRFLDFASGVAVTALGHAHPKLVATIQAAAQKPWHLANLYNIPEQSQLADRLVALSFADYAFFVNSGAEALELSIKVARKYQYENGHPEKNRIITIEGAFHGRTLATLAAGGQEKYLKGFDPRIDGFDQVPWGNMNELRNAVTAQTGAILIEPIQGEGGIRAADADYLNAIRAVCDEFGLLLIYDEVQCGVGRTGKMFAYEWSGVAPDIMALAKGLGGGFPVGACLTSAKAASGMSVGSHGSTFGGNPLAMAVAGAVIDEIAKPGFLDNVQTMAKRLHDGLADLVARYPAIYSELRGSGLMLGLKCGPVNGEVMTKLREQGLLTVAAGDNVVRLLPPLIIGSAEVDLALSILETVAADWKVAE